jgi:phenylalanyl-tRNA synthetase beta chain
LLSGVLNVLERNIRAGAKSVRLFELGRTFSAPDAAEERRLALLCCGNVAGNVDWRAGERRRLDFFDLKGAIESLGSDAVTFRRAERAGLAFAAELLAGDNVVGYAGQLTSAHATRLGATAPVFVLEVQLTALTPPGAQMRKFTELDKFPSVTRDIAMLQPEALPHGEIQRVLLSGNEPLLADAQIFDLFSGNDAQNVGSGRKSVAYTLTYRAQNRTLTNDEVTVVHTRIRERLKERIGSELRE